MDVLTNILHNTLAYLNSCCGSSIGSISEEIEADFPDLGQLQEYSLACMICLLQQARPHLRKSDAMWCLLTSDLQVGKASTMEIPLIPFPTSGCTLVLNNLDRIGDGGFGVVLPALCRFHGGWRFGNGVPEFPVNGLFSNGIEMTLQREIECPERFNLSPSMKSLLKRNVALFVASFRANSKQIHIKNLACATTMPSGVAPLAVPGSNVQVDKYEESKNFKSQDGVNSIFTKFHDLNIHENLEHVGDDQKGEMIISLLHKIKDLEKQVKERKEWAHQKEMQVATKLSSDLT
ncbi:hypothetical protein V6N11_052009 [Hibiscus sabdariffa]|uniref:PIR2-like helical domain-containing protein n=1 Tax=Hibiscus sabdariffa TaxID=183260 RepID=A0ABR2U919_9ROSI